MNWIYLYLTLFVLCAIGLVINALRNPPEEIDHEAEDEDSWGV